MIIIYDFDGTLTPYSLPQYEILHRFGYTDEPLRKRLDEETEKDSSLGLYDAYYKCYKDILSENGIPMNKETVSLGADKVKLNNGVIDYFEKFKKSKTGIKHFIITSGIREYVTRTEIAKYVDEIYGVTFKEVDGLYQDIDMLVTDEKKVDIIKEIQRGQKRNEKIIYFGDGITDEYAFEYIHSQGGKNVFIAVDPKSRKVFDELNQKRLIDECFGADFGNDSKLASFVEDLLMDEIMMGGRMPY